MDVGQLAQTVVVGTVYLKAHAFDIALGGEPLSALGALLDAMWQVDPQDLTHHAGSDLVHGRWRFALRAVRDAGWRDRRDIAAALAGAITYLANRPLRWLPAGVRSRTPGARVVHFFGSAA
jgi:hypothetical protein